MSLVTNISDLTTRVATEVKALRTLINGNAADLSALDTTATNNLVAAINEVFAAVSSGGATNLDGLSDVVITAAATGDILRHNGTNWVDVDGATIFQLLDADLTALAAAGNSAVLAATTASFLTADETKLDGIEALADVTDAGNIASSIHGASAKTTPVTNDEFAIIDSAASNVLKRMTWGNVLAAVVAAIVDSAPGTLDTLNELAAALGDDPDFATTITTALAGKQPLDTDLTAIAALTSAANKGLQSTGAGTWALYDLTAAGKALLDDADATAQRATLSVYSTTEIGDPTTNFVTTFEAGLT